jgi:hypothetical protein
VLQILKDIAALHQSRQVFSVVVDVLRNPYHRCLAFVCFLNQEDDPVSVAWETQAQCFFRLYVSVAVACLLSLVGVPGFHVKDDQTQALARPFAFVVYFLSRMGGPGSRVSTDHSQNLDQTS